MTTGTGTVVLENETPATNGTNFVQAVTGAGATLALEVTESAELGANAEIKDGTIVTLTGDAELSVPGAHTLTVKGVLDAVAGSVTAGTTNTVAFATALITGDTTTGVLLAGGTGTATFTAEDELIVADGGTIVTAGTGTAVFGATTFGSATDGTWTATGSGTSGGSGVSGVKITSAAADAGATIVVSAGADAWTAAVLTASGTDPVVTQATGAGNALDIATGASVDLGTAGKLVLSGDASNGAKLTGAGKVVAGNASITGGASGAWQAQGVSTSIALSSSEAAVVALAGTGTSPVLAGLTDDSALITLAKGAIDGDAAALTVTNATIDLSVKGSLVFPWVADTPATLVLKGGTGTLGALKLGGGTETSSNTLLTNADEKSVTISGTTPVIQGSEDEAPVAGLVSGGETAGDNDATITGQTATDDVTITAGATLVENA